MDYKQLGGPGFLLSAGAAWIISAAALVLLGAVLLRILRGGEDSLAYVSSAVSFLTAFAAGMAAARINGGKRFAVGLISGFAICILLLTVGFLIRAGSLDPSAVLSVASFTITGALSGALLSGTGKKTRRKSGLLRKA